MKLEDIDIVPASFSEATHAAYVKIGDCELFVPCKSKDEVRHIQQVLTEFFGDSDESDDPQIA